VSVTLPTYDGPIEPGMIFWAPDNDGEVYRRDMILCQHPTRPEYLVIEALDCAMRKNGRGVGNVHLIPEINLRIVMRPEEAE
jgi:hypothetical protein